MTANNRLTEAPNRLTLTEVRDLGTITIEQAASVLGIGRTLAYDQARRGALPAMRVGGRLVVPVPRLLAVLDNPTNPSEEAR